MNDYREEQWNSSRYRYGPKVTWHTRNVTDSSIIPWTGEIPLNDWVDFIIEIPYTALSGKVPVSVGISGQFYNLSEMKDGEMRPSGQNPISVLAFYFVNEDRWEVYSSKAIVWPEQPPHDLQDNTTLLDVFGPPTEPFAEMAYDNCSYIPGRESYWGRLRLKFNSSTIAGFYTFSATVFDRNFNPLTESQFSETSGRLIGTDLTNVVDTYFGGQYTVTRVSDDGNILYTANRGEDFNITWTIYNGTTLTEAMAQFSFPTSVKAQKWVYGPYQETQTRTGAWEWDSDGQTYVWNSSAVVSWSEPKFGYHWEDTYTWVNLGKTYNFYDPWGNWTEERETWPSYVCMYNFTASAWQEAAAYHYENNTWVDDHWEFVRWEEYEPWNPDWPVPYVLNATASSIYYDGDGALIVNMRGHISEEMLPSSSEFGDVIWFNERVRSGLEIDLVNSVFLPTSNPQDQVDYEYLKSLAVDTPVSIVNLLHKGEPYSPSWMFQANIGDPFTVFSRLQGGASLADDIDGVAFVLHGFQDRWGEDIGLEWWQTSEITVEVKVGPSREAEVNVYNYTVRTSWGYGEHYEWAEVEIAPGIWEIQRVLVEDWFWQEQVWDFEAGDWTDQHFPMKSSKAKMPGVFLMVGNISYGIVDNDLRVIFDITPASDMPSLEWNWDYFYGNLTWVTDYESGWGSHTVLGWTEDTVYHCMNGTDMLYAEMPYRSAIFRNNATGELYKRSKIPFIKIDGKVEPLKDYVFGGIQSTYVTLVRDEYDYVLDKDRHYIKLYNGTEREVFSDRVAVVYNVTLWNGTSFLSYSEGPQYMGNFEAIDYYYMIGLDGSAIVGDWNSLWNGYSSVREDMAPTTLVQYRYITYATPISPFRPSKTLPLVMVGWPEYIGDERWVMRLSDTLEEIEFTRYWGEGWLYMYTNITDGFTYVFEWPWECLSVNYKGQDAFIPHYVTKVFAYLTLGGVNYPVPAPGEPLNSIWDLDWVIRTKYSIDIAYINGTGYRADKLRVWVTDHWEDYQEYNPGPPS
ncbi:MAG: hypothetical protein DRO87_09570, partial [Candidatus Thorarchaeota archaeon]